MPQYETVSVQLREERFEAPAQGVLFRDSELVDVDMHDLTTPHFAATASTFEGCDLRRLRPRAGWLSLRVPPTVYRECRFDGSDLRALRPGTARFERCSFEAVRADRWLCHTAEFVGCRFAGTLREVVFSGRPFPPSWAETLGRARNDFTGNDFTDAELVDVAFVHGIDLSAQRLPAGDGYVLVRDARARIDRARDEVRRWPDGEGEAALRMLRFFSEAGYEAQDAIFTSRSSPAHIPEAVRARVWDLLASA